MNHISTRNWPQGRHIETSIASILANQQYHMYTVRSGVSRISFRGGFKIFLEKWGNLHGAKRHAARGEATRLLGGFGGMLPRENFKKWCNLGRFREYFAKILSKKYF